MSTVNTQDNINIGFNYTWCYDKAGTILNYLYPILHRPIGINVDKKRLAISKGGIISSGNTMLGDCILIAIIGLH